MTAQIVHTKRFQRDLKRMGAWVQDVTRLESELLADPEAGDLVIGLGGIRKLRFRLGNRGKSHAGRDVYFVAVAPGVIMLVFAYAKSEQDDITPQQRRTAIEVMKEFNDDNQD